MAVGRRNFIAAAGLGAVASSGSAQDYGQETSYEERVRPNVTVGLGRGQAASMSVVWLPRPGREQLPPVKARLVLFDLGGKPLAEKEALLEPFHGASLDYEVPRGTRRQQVFGYAFVQEFAGQLAEELFAGIEVYDVSSGRADIVGGPLPIA